MRTQVFFNLAASAVLMGSATLASAQDFAVTWYSVDCGGGTSTSATFAVSGTIGQHDAAAPMAGATFSVTGGYWGDAGLGCPADINNDGEVNPDDLGDYINCYFSTPPCPLADRNNDGNIDPDDLGDFLNVFFGPPC